MPIRMQSVGDWRRRYGVVSPTAKECITFMLWEQQTYTSATTTVLTFFQTGTTGFNGNLQAGQLPNGNSFLVQALRIAPMPNTWKTASAAPAAAVTNGAIQDMTALIREGTCQFKVGDKLFGNWPIFVLPAAGGPWGFISAGASLTAPADNQRDFASNGVPDVRNAYTFPIPITLPPQYPFSVTLTWNGAQTLNAGNPKIFAMLDGQLIRPVQ